MTNEIRAYITSLGVTIIGEFASEDTNKIVLNSALFLSATQNPQNPKEIIPNFAPVAVFAPGEPLALKGTDNVKVYKHAIAMEHPLHDQIVDLYKQRIGKVSIVSASAITQLNTLTKR